LPCVLHDIESYELRMIYMSAYDSKRDSSSLPAAKDTGDPNSVRLSDQLLINTFMNNSQDTIYFKDHNSKFVLNSKAHAQGFGVKNPRELIGKSDMDFFPESFARQTMMEEQEIMRTGQPQIGKIERWKQPAGNYIWFSASKYPLYDENGKIVGTWGTSRDVTELKMAENALANANKKLEKLSRMDELSGLCNRRCFYERMKKAASRYDRMKKIGQDTSFCLIVLDIDRFKSVNDTLGHLLGDEVIRHIAGVLTKHSRSSDTVFRVGGDEYAILLLETELAAAKAQAEHLRKIVQDSPLDLHDAKIELTISMGVSCYCDHLDIRKMIHDADMHLYQSKNMGRNLVY